MARYSPVYNNFLPRLSEIQILRRRARELERRDPVGANDEIDAICRGAVVLLSSHVEAYIKELGEHALERLVSQGVCRSNLDAQFFYYISKNKFDEINSTVKPEKIAAGVFKFVEEDSCFWQKTNQIPAPINSEKFNKGFSNPKYPKIKSYFRRFGYKTYDGDLRAILQQDSNSVINMVTQLVDTRNLIAHGDPSATQTPNDITNTITMITRFCRATDDVFLHVV